MESQIILLIFILVLAMIVIGGITRITDSGLSMVEWRPIWGFLPPISDEEWRRVFSLYMNSPEYIFKNHKSYHLIALPN